MKRPAYTPSESWFSRDGVDGACVRLERAVRERGAWGDVRDPLFQEYIAREHLDGRMPIVELHRNHGISLAAVRRWIAIFREAGRAGLEAASRSARPRRPKPAARVRTRRQRRRNVRSRRTTCSPKRASTTIG